MSKFDEQLKQQVADLREIIRLFQEMEKKRAVFELARLIHPSRRHTQKDHQRFNADILPIEQQIEALLTKHNLKA